MGGKLRWLWLGLAVLIAAAFAYLNASERVAVHLGFAVLFQVRLVALVFFVYLLGMGTMYLLGLGHDLRVRRVLREHGLEVFPGRDEEAEPAREWSLHGSGDATDQGGLVEEERPAEEPHLSGDVSGMDPDDRPAHPPADWQRDPMS